MATGGMTGTSKAKAVAGKAGVSYGGGSRPPRARKARPMPRRMTDIEFAQIYQTEGPKALVDRLGIARRNVQARRVRVEANLGVRLIAPGDPAVEPIELESPDIHINMKDGVVLVGGDGHYWPGVESTAHRAFVKFAQDMNPKVVVFNGDALDGANISRHPPIGWENLPTVEDELLCVQERLGEIHAAAPRARHLWPLGNHDARFNTRLAMVASEFRNVQGTRLVHHFPEWEPCWVAFLGGERGAVVKHRFKGGIHATHSNALWSGRTMVTNHLHSLKVTPFTDYNGTRWGVDAGCLAMPTGPQFTYQERNPANHRSGFAVLTWKKGELLMPELVSVHDEKKGLVNFRGDLIKV